MIYGLQVAMQALPLAPSHRSQTRSASQSAPVAQSVPAPEANSEAVTEHLSSRSEAEGSASSYSSQPATPNLQLAPSPSARRVSSTFCVRATAPVATPNSSPPPNSPSAQTPARRLPSSKNPDPPCPLHNLQLTTCNLQLSYQLSMRSQRTGGQPPNLGAPFMTVPPSWVGNHPRNPHSPQAALFHFPRFCWIMRKVVRGLTAPLPQENSGLATGANGPVSRRVRWVGFQVFPVQNKLLASRGGWPR
jgi:hypothetical protein